MAGDTWCLEPFAAPLHLTSLRRFVVAHAIPGVERHDADGVCTRTVPAAHGTAIVQVDLSRSRGEAIAVGVTADARDVEAVRGRIRDWLGLDADPGDPDLVMGRDPVLAADVAARPGLRVPGTVDPVEAALFTVLGQQVSMAAARTFAGRLSAAYGRDVGSSLVAFPTAETVASSTPDRLQQVMGVTGARARAVHALAVELRDSPLASRGCDEIERSAIRSRLLALPGIGPWTVDLIALRALGDPDVFLPGDLVARRAMGAPNPAAAAATALRWQPYRSHALLHLWTRAVFSDPVGQRSRDGG